MPAGGANILRIEKLLWTALNSSTSLQTQRGHPLPPWQDHNLQFGRSDSHRRCFTLSWKLQPMRAEVYANQAELDTLCPLAVPRNSIHKI